MIIYRNAQQVAEPSQIPVPYEKNQLWRSEFREKTNFLAKFRYYTLNP